MTPQALAPLCSDRRGLIVVAAAAEADAVLRARDADPAIARAEWETRPIADHLSLLVTGVGKANAAGALASCLDPSRFALVVNLGVAGALPGADLELTHAILATRSAYADEGVRSPDGFQDVASMGFPLFGESATSIPASPELVEVLGPLADRTGVIATVSTCSGTDAGAQEIARRTGAIAESMEGAALAFTVARLNATSPPTGSGVLFAELRIISNTTGDRDRQRWDLTGALGALERLAARL